jgi:CheY-like chemotaxis protein
MIGQLEREGFAVRAAGSVTETLAALGKEPADVVVLDLNLPDGDGLACAATCVRAAIPMPSSWSPRAMARSTACWGWSWAPTTI